MHPDESAWGLPEQLLAAIADTLNVANWQRGNGSQRDYPKPIPRPGVEEDLDKTTYGKGALPLEEMAEWLGWTNT